MRRPSLAQRFGIRSRIGLSNVLAGNATAEEAIFQVSDISNLWVLPAGPNTPHPAEMLESKTMENLLAKLRREFDYIIVDTPPVLSVTDAVVVSVFADAFVLVSRSGKTTRQAMRRSRDLLWQVNAKLMGIVINAVDMNAADKYYYNYYYGADYNRRYYGDASSDVDTPGVKEEHSTSAPSKN